MPLSIQYGQKHSKELEAAASILAYYGIEGKTMDVTTIVCLQQLLFIDPIHQRQYLKVHTKEQQEVEGEGMVSTYVPFRNGLFYLQRLP